MTFLLLPFLKKTMTLEQFAQKSRLNKQNENLRKFMFRFLFHVCRYMAKVLLIRYKILYNQSLYYMFCYSIGTSDKPRVQLLTIAHAPVHMRLLSVKMETAIADTRRTTTTLATTIRKSKLFTEPPYLVLEIYCIHHP